MMTTQDSTMTHPQMVVIQRGCTLFRFVPYNCDNLILSFLSTDAYDETGNPAYFGETIGRVANRISNARIDDLNGRSYKLPANGDNGETCLHGGVMGWGKQMWHRALADEARPDSQGRMYDKVQKFTLLSRDGDEGFPGNVEARAWFFHYQDDDTSVVEIEYEAQMTNEQPDGVDETVVSMTNHSYFNLTPTNNHHAPSISGTIVTLPNTKFLQVRNSDNIPTGEIITPEDGSPIQANAPFLLGHNIPRLDHCFVLNDDPSTIPLDSRSASLRKCITLEHPQTGVNLEVWSSEPACQVYTGDYVDVRCDQVYFGKRSGVAVEPGRYTNAVNQEGWQHMVRLKRGEVWGSRIRYIAWRAPPSNGHVE